MFLKGCSVDEDVFGLLRFAYERNENICIHRTKQHFRVCFHYSRPLFILWGFYLHVRFQVRVCETAAKPLCAKLKDVI